MDYLLEMNGITKMFGSFKAVDNVTLKVKRGETLSLCGENGSGKSTLMKVLSGLYPYGDWDGEILFDGKPLKAATIHDTEDIGIGIIHQELALVKQMTVLENMFLGMEWANHGVMDYDRMYLRCREMLQKVRLDVDPHAVIGELGLGQRQLVEIAKALGKNLRLLILDEPTASLTEKETDILLNIIRELHQQGITCIYISHKLNEVKAISDTVCIIRDGVHIATEPAASLTEQDIIAKMVGRELKDLYPHEEHGIGDEVLRVEHLTAWHPVYHHIRRVDDVSFALHKGEILGVAGLVGSGRTDVAQCLFGCHPGRSEG
ncbi:MAG: ATP-binding cassette domain-containing protein, partial [Methylobacteriaceae bacterium]|nr:ATP-binding cassette domain-containing protein [Methylobacteriaceae bacterium]